MDLDWYIYSESDYSFRDPKPSTGTENFVCLTNNLENKPTPFLILEHNACAFMLKNILHILNKKWFHQSIVFNIVSYVMRNTY